MPPSFDSGDKAINAPIYSVQLGGQMPLCRHTTPFATPSATWTAGQSVTVKFNPSIAAHSGGHCEFSISYDNGNTFAVIHQELRYCFLGSKPSGLTNTASVLTYTFNLPANLPSSDKAVFSWTWINASGNRELYMNCADVAIKGGSSSSYTGKQMTLANYPGYPTIPEFNGNYDTGIDVYSSAKNITISPAGGSSGSNNGSNGGGTPATTTTAASYSTTGSATATASTPIGHTPSISTPAYSSAAPVSSAPATNPKPTQTANASQGGNNGGGSCTEGAMQCSANKSGFQYCIGGQWSQTYTCGSGTVCKGEGSSVYCGWA
ncbi:hypothetical protein FBU59_001121 [Linderina macrospora]|uniref:Uncharacterized protein n=1 Tax=Linderina macrospora TaxID=4868 RepID=A0ACC1JF79_9FUNG|nr:hypothetical protein FBU59_001121 [Linderina macrospora]